LQGATEAAVHTCARDVEAGRSKFEEVAAGEPVTEESIQSVLALHCAWKEAEAAFQQGVKEKPLLTKHSLHSFECHGYSNVFQ